MIDHLDPLDPLEADEEGEVLIDPKASEREYWRDNAGLQREVWRPGDGDGDPAEDSFDIRGKVGTLEKRWRFYQISIGPIKHRINEAPKRVVLDDLACWDLLCSNMPKSQLQRFYTHDFAGAGRLRFRRPHRGRPALKDPNATSEEERYQSFDYGGKAGRYFFSGERAYTPILYGPYKASPEPKQEPTEAETPDSLPIKKGHNQYTPIEELVRNGAQSSSKTKGKYRERVNTFLRRSPSPPFSRNRQLIFNNTPIVRTIPRGVLGFGDAPLNAGLNFNPTHGMPRDQRYGPMPAVPQQPVESMFIEQDDDNIFGPSVLDSSCPGFAEDRLHDIEQSRPRRVKRPREMGYIERLAAGLLEEDLEAEHEAMLAKANAPSGAENAERVKELEGLLEQASATINAQYRELGDLKARLEALQSEVAMERSKIDG